MASYGTPRTTSTGIRGRGSRNARVGDIRQRSPSRPPEPARYVPQAQNPRRGMAFFVATDGDPEELLGPLRAAVREVEPDQPIERLAPFRDMLDQAAARERFFTAALGGFGALALLLASLGIYGVVSTGVGRRLDEIGTRLALGADRRRILAMVVQGAMRPVLAGVALGLAVAWTAVLALEPVVFGVSPRDPATFAVVALGLLTVSVLASWIPAGRASRLDPVTALRAE